MGIVRLLFYMLRAIERVKGIQAEPSAAELEEMWEEMKEAINLDEDDDDEDEEEEEDDIDDDESFAYDVCPFWTSPCGRENSSTGHGHLGLVH